MRTCSISRLGDKYHAVRLCASERRPQPNDMNFGKFGYTEIWAAVHKRRSRKLSKQSVAALGRQPVMPNRTNSETRADSRVAKHHEHVSCLILPPNSNRCELSRSSALLLNFRSHIAECSCHCNADCVSLTAHGLPETPSPHVALFRVVK